MKICTFEDCNKKQAAKGLCNSHYKQLKRKNKLSRLNKTLEERFLEKIDKIHPNGCWIWIGSRNNDGYGQIFADKTRKVVRANRLSYKLYKGDISNNMCVLHKCDNPPCVNPEHLFLGTVKDNMKDMKLKGRGIKACGENQHCSKFTNEQVISIRKRLDEGARNSDIAKEFNVNVTTIEKIKYRKSWKHI